MVVRYKIEWHLISLSTIEVPYFSTTLTLYSTSFYYLLLQYFAILFFLHSKHVGLQWGYLFNSLFKSNSCCEAIFCFSPSSFYFSMLSVKSIDALVGYLFTKLRMILCSRRHLNAMRFQNKNAFWRNVLMHFLPLLRLYFQTITIQPILFCLVSQFMLELIRKLKIYPTPFLTLRTKLSLSHKIMKLLLPFEKMCSTLHSVQKLVNA